VAGPTARKSTVWMVCVLLWLDWDPAPIGFSQRVTSFVSPEAGSLGLIDAVIDVSGYSQGRCREH